MRSEPELAEDFIDYMAEKWKKRWSENLHLQQELVFPTVEDVKNLLHEVGSDFGGKISGENLTLTLIERSDRVGALIDRNR